MFLVIVVIVVAVEVAVMIMVRMMVVLKPSAISIPVTGEVSLSIMVRSNPMCAFIGRPGPIASVPFVVMSDWIPVTLDPNEVWPGSHGRYRNYAGCRRSADYDSDRDLGLRRRHA